MVDLRALLEAAQTIELVDWPHQDVPATLFRAGYTVVGHEPSSLMSYVVAAEPLEASIGRSFPLADGSYLQSVPIAALPERVDIVNTYRPAEEQPDIVHTAIALGARTFWVQPGETTSQDARQIATAAGLAFVDGVCIADTVRELGIAKPRAPAPETPQAS
jgi:hypothetical protein